MATGITSVSSLNSLFASIYEDAFLVMRANNIMTNLVTVHTDSQGTESRIYSSRPAISMASASETTDFATPTVYGKSAAGTVTPSLQMAQVILTDRELRQDPQTRIDAAAELGAAAAAKIERDLTGLFDDLTLGTVGTAGSILTWGHVQAAQSRLAAGTVPGRYSLVLHDYQWHSLGTAVGLQKNLASTPDVVKDELARSFYVGSYGMCDIFVTPNVGTASGTGTAAMFNREALALDMRLAPRIEYQRDASFGGGAWEINIVADYGVGVRRGGYGVTVLGADTLPA